MTKGRINPRKNNSFWEFNSPENRISRLERRLKELEARVASLEEEKRPKISDTSIDLPFKREN